VRWPSPRRIAVAAVLLAVVAAGARWGPRWIGGGGSGREQRALAGGAMPRAAVAPDPAARVRVVVVDGLSRADTDRVPAFGALCERGLEVTVDVGFPTKSLAIQLALWTGLTADQLGAPTINVVGWPTPRASIPAAVPGSIAVVESHRFLAESAGFRVGPADPAADAEDPRADPRAVEAWRGRPRHTGSETETDSETETETDSETETETETEADSETETDSETDSDSETETDSGFFRAATAATSGNAPLAMIHLLAVDEAAHAHGRSGRAYAAALARADALIAAVAAAAPPSNLLIVLADHGHLARGGHGDAEDEVRRVRACIIQPSTASATAGAADPNSGLIASGTFGTSAGKLGAPAAPAAVAASTAPAPRGAELHLVDLSRLIADALGAPLDPRAVGRPLAVALAHPDRDATLPRPSGARWSIALAIAALFIALGAYRLGSAAWIWTWPFAAYGLYRAVAGAPSLSAMPRLGVAIATAAPLVALAALAVRRQGSRAIALAAALPPAIVAAVFAVVSRIPDAVVTAAPPRMPWWTAHVTWAAQVLAVGVTVAALALVCPERGRPAAKPP
jgi:hypothetical protein